MVSKRLMVRILAAVLFMAVLSSSAQTSALLENAKLAVIQGNSAEAIASLQSISKDSPDYAEACHLLGLAYYESEDYQMAAASLQKAAALKKDDLSIKILLAKANEKLGQTPAAVKILLDIITLDSLNIKVYRNLANIYFKEKEYNDAGRIYDKLLRLDNSKSHLFRQAGLCAF
jgi:tetratricopeptide (TPR) repeat protein